jgi:predicted deacetylase
MDAGATTATRHAREAGRSRIAVRNGAWLEPLRRELDAATSPRTFFFRDDDAGWANGWLLALLDLFAHYSAPLDVAVIPAALDRRLAASLRRRPETERGLLAFHQHGFTHANHARSGRPCEFGPDRPARAQRRDIAAGARRLRELLGGTAPIFTPPWNRCTETTGRCLLGLGFRALVRDSSATPLELVGLQELEVHVDWSSRRRRIPRREVGELLAAAARDRGSAGVMFHHALIGPDERESIGRLLALLASHGNARCVPLSSLVAAGERGTSFSNVPTRREGSGDHAAPNLPDSR